MRQQAKVKYQIATYRGTVIVFCDSDDDDEVIIAKAKKQLKRKGGPLPFGYESFKVLNRESVESY